MHLLQQFTYQLAYCKSITKLSVYGCLQSIRTLGMSGDEQTARAPKHLDGYSAAPAGQRVVEVKTSAEWGVCLKPCIGEKRRSVPFSAVCAHGLGALMVGKNRESLVFTNQCGRVL